MIPEGTQERRKEDWPPAEMPVKGAIPGSPDPYTFPEHLVFCKSGLLSIFCPHYLSFVAKGIYPGEGGGACSQAHILQRLLLVV